MENLCFRLFLIENSGLTTSVPLHKYTNGEQTLNLHDKAKMQRAQVQTHTTNHEHPINPHHATGEGHNSKVVERNHDNHGQ